MKNEKLKMKYETFKSKRENEILKIENFIVLNYNVLNGNVYIVPRDKNTMNLIGNL